MARRRDSGAAAEALLTSMEEAMLPLFVVWLSVMVFIMWYFFFSGR